MIAPSQKISEVDKNQQTTQKQLESDEPKISAAAEKADSADSRAGDALGRADAASKKTDQVRTELQNRSKFSSLCGANHWSIF